MKNKFLLGILVIVLALTFLGVGQMVEGQVSGQPGQVGGQPETQKLSFEFENPLRTGNNVLDLLKAIINEIILPLGGVLAVLAFIYSGFKYVTARGNTTKIEEANRALLYTAIGTAILLGSWVITNVIVNTVNKIIAP